MKYVIFPLRKYFYSQNMHKNICFIEIINNNDVVQDILYYVIKDAT